MQNLFLTSITIDELRALVAAAIRSEISNLPTKEAGPSQSEFLTRKQTAERLQVSLVTLHQWTKTGVIQGYRIAGRVRYKPEEVESALKGIKTLKNKG